MRRKPKQQRSEQMVKTILEAALDVVARQGMDGTTTRHIAERAGISVGTLYHYFNDKNDVYAALQKTLTDGLVLRIRGLIPELVRKDIGTVIREILTMFLDELERDGGKQLAFMRNIMQRGFGREMGRIEQVMMELSLVYTAQHPELARMKDLNRVTYILFNSVTFNLIRHLDSPAPHVSREQLVSGLSDMCVAYINAQMPGGATATPGQ